MDRETLEDRAIFATGGSLESDCAAFRRPDQGHSVSPWFRLPLKLHSVESARGELQHVGRVGEGTATTTDRPPTCSARTARSVNWRGRKPLCNKDFSENLTFCPVGRVSAFRRSQPCPGGFILPR